MSSGAIQQEGEKGKNFLVFGGKDTGKTHLCKGFAMVRRRQGKTIIVADKKGNVTSYSEFTDINGQKVASTYYSLEEFKKIYQKLKPKDITIVRIKDDDEFDV